ncbi:cysteine--tRNA ligase [Pararhodobacter oceanensis]|uniref:Cysteine--tRNA ligase n=1 Tax=Pararhodobacter oceanensis TaxID=2172121 RepID=A0A2T8HYB4_9RHOB|nr:cysteine--tRNA ligase [Pararhodobacter oceanensis]PVH30389.1 cysteine--tRNA ligase [Pararhodobacter oceanensis]
MTTIHLHNTATRKKQVFTPLDPENIRMYVCGPTVYDRAHLGNARPVVVFDVLFRLLRHEFGADHVTYVRNFTDVDDKINNTALERQKAGAEGTLEELIAERTEETIGWYHADMDALGAMRPTKEPRATQYIGAMISMIEGLIAKGHAYAKDGHVLFRVRSYAEYGALSGRSVDDMIAGARVEVAPFKEDPMDFVLWKPSGDDLPGWESPWGRGRPGWHIECSAMSHELLGPSFDIHGGGLDLQFPHHENEIAQSCCAHPGAGFASVWMHNEMLLVEGKKMSKSLGNFFTVRELLDQGYAGEVIRFVMLSTHYRKTMDWTEKKAQEAEKTLWEWHALAKDVQPSAPSAALVDALSDDLNTHAAITELHRQANVLMAFEAGADLPDSFDADQAYSQFVGSAQLVGLMTPEVSDWAENAYDLSGLEMLLESYRSQAMQTKDFSAVDRLKNSLIEAGVEVRMSKSGVELLAGSNFNPEKLAGLA